ncbi:xanthine dehydrogenase small subunit [Lacibacterium aquatile]|uniref:Xanthine dehydrogenase small subunit n=1 Tax=Lacibacterium aquatile TaxID=1168082 RepID=A0ABW5DUU9_9PROT
MGETIRFLLGSEVREVRVDDPNRTVLEFLREEERRRGTKEGCAEGDCGACSVVVGEADGRGGVRYKPVNACIQFLGSLDGKQLITVEDLADPVSGALHPVQQAMAEGGGAQCGFCTPGFVMALYSFHREGHEATPEAVSDQLAGNLCRCTGYRPILDAAAKAAPLPIPDHQKHYEQTAAEQLGAWAANAGDLEIKGADGSFLSPVSLTEALVLRRRFPQATLLAGGTDVGLWVTKQHRRLDPVIYLGRVPELLRIEESETSVTIGAAVTFQDALPVLAKIHPDLGELVRRIGSTQVRAAGTLGGNIANGSPIGDSMPALIALGATLHLAGPGGKRSMPLEDFYIAYRKTALGPDEILEAVTVPRLGEGQIFATYKISKRFDQDISAVCPAYCLTVSGETISQARIVHGGMAGTPARAPKAEAALVGKPFGAPGIQAAMAALGEDYQPMTDMRASADYRLTVARNCLWRFYLAQNCEAGTRLDPRKGVA